MNLEWDRLKVFYYVAKEKSISRAAERLRTFQPSVTRSIQQLEHQANSKLFIRNRKGLILTQQGEILFKHVKNALTEIELAQNQMSGVAEEVSGVLKITTTYAYASTVLFPYICDFSLLYPKIKVRLVCDDMNLDLTKRDADVAVRPYDPNAPELEQIFLYERKLQLFASEEYIREMGYPEKPEDLDKHRFVVFEVNNGTIPNAINNNNWMINLGMSPGRTRETHITVNTVECLAQAAEKGLGIITLSDDSLLTKKFKRILPNIEGPSLRVCYVYPSSLSNLQTVQLLGNYLKEVFFKLNCYE